MNLKLAIPQKWAFNLIAVLSVYSIACTSSEPVNNQGPVQISGIYPHLAYYNNENECGTGAVVPWADRLWVITYGPHLPNGSSDKLYEITPDLQQIVREESIGGTPANRMIHSESGQLFIGPYAIGKDRTVRAIPYTTMPGRHTGNARHLSDPARKIYYGTMEEGFYEVDVHTLEVNMLYKDGNKNGNLQEDTQVNPQNAMLPGAHGKGLYSGQGVLVYSSNGEATPEAKIQFDIESGVLAEWDGKDWRVVRRNQFVEVTGPGGIYGNTNPATDPIWATGWDHKSVLLGVRNPETGWSFFRLPKASHSYDGAHGWNTEWPRIRDVGTPAQPDYLMTMHGLFWRFPADFMDGQTAGIRPRSAYLKVIGDFARWQDQLVFGCDDSAKKEFLNTRKQKGTIEGPGQSNSNVWFTPLDQPDHLGPATVSGSVWLEEMVSAHAYSEPFLFAGWQQRAAWLHHAGKVETDFTFEVDETGTGTWKVIKTVKVAPATTEFIEFPESAKGEWIRVKPSNNTEVTLSFNYSNPDKRTPLPDARFQGLATIDANPATGGLLYGLGDDRRALGVATIDFSGNQAQATGYYELDAQLQLLPKDDPKTTTFIRDKFAIPRQVVEIDASSVLVIDDLGRRWRFPLGPDAYTGLTNAGQLRICREVATERDLFNCHGTFYELPAENADGFAKVRPIASHNFRIHDYASYRGLLVMTGIQPDAKVGTHLIKSADGKAAVWAGTIDDLWQLGKPVGRGGPWKDTKVQAGIPSDPYLIGFYGHRSLRMEHDAKEAVTFTIEVEPIGHGPWMTYQRITIPAGETYEYNFPASFQARWIRFAADKDCRATAWLEYE